MNARTLLDCCAYPQSGSIQKFNMADTRRNASDNENSFKFKRVHPRVLTTDANSKLMAQAAIAGPMPAWKLMPRVWAKHILWGVKD